MQATQDKRVSDSQPSKVKHLHDLESLKNMERMQLADRRISPEQVRYLSAEEVTEILLNTL